MFNKITLPRYGFRALAAAAVAVALLASCSVDQPVNVSGHDGISFRASVGASTKASEVNASNLTGFNVTAIGNGASYFTDMAVSVDGGTCTAAKTYYWPSYELGFYAYANVSGGTVSITNSAKTISGVTPAAAASEQTDMIVAYETGNKTDNESAGVPLNFRHALSQVVVKAANLSTSGIQIKVAGVKLGNILDRGTFTYPATTTTTQNSGTLSQSLWNTSAAELTDYTIAKAATDTVLSSTAKSIMFGGAAWMVIPQQLTARASFADASDEGSSIGVMVQILDADDVQLYPATEGQYAYTNIPIGTNWEPGKKYTYTLNFLDEANGGGAGVDDNDDPVLGLPIRFTLTVDDWDPQNVQTLPNGTSAIVGLLMSTPSGLRRLDSGETLSVSSGSPLELSGETLDELHLSLVDAAETVIPAAKFSLSKNVLSSSDSDVELELTGEKPVALEYDTDYRGPNLVVEDGDDNVLAEFAVEAEYETPDDERNLTFEVISGGTIMWKCSNASISKTISYRKNGGDWTDITSTTAGATINVANGDVVEFKGENDGYSTSGSLYNSFVDGSAVYYVYGNVNSLVDFSGSLSDYCYCRLFYNNTCLRSHSSKRIVLPASSLTTTCYYYMFSGCTSLTVAPELPATTLANSCYYGMFENCSSLIAAPELPATTLERACYCRMFKGCSGLSVAPELPATTLTNACYQNMFEKCSSLIAAPELPATTLEQGCYSGMFGDCTNLAVAPELPATTLTSDCYSSMFCNCTNLTAAPELPSTTMTNSCYYSMFYGCTGLIAAPELPATTLAEQCYRQMFINCSNLTSAPELPATTLESNCYRQMFSGCTSLTVAPELPATTLAQECCLGMFQNCSNLTTAPIALPATTLANQCYRSMFGGCTNLTTAPELPATTLASQCYSAMFQECTSLTAAPELPATTLASGCYERMFEKCTSLTAAPELPATTLLPNCYQYMFSRCTNLAYVKCLATVTSASNCLGSWLYNVNSTGTFVKHPDMASWPSGASGIPSGWTVEDATL